MFFCSCEKLWKNYFASCSAAVAARFPNLFGFQQMGRRAGRRWNAKPFKQGAFQMKIRFFAAAMPAVTAVSLFASPALAKEDALAAGEADVAEIAA